MEGARGVLLSVAGPSSMTLHEATTAAQVVSQHADDDAEIIFGALVDESLGEEMRVTVIAAGFDRKSRRSASFRPTQQAAPPGSSGEPPTRRPFDPSGDDDLDIPTFVQG
jgi:cell division protein FtsZ